MAITITFQKATEESGLSLRTLQYLAARGELKTITVGRRRLIPVRAFQDLLLRGARHRNKDRASGSAPGSIPLFKHAINSDANFAMAYASLGVAYNQLVQTKLSAEAISRAYELRDRVSAQEKFYIESVYYQYATGDLEKARQVNQQWSQEYPRDDAPLRNLFTVLGGLGQYEPSLTEAIATRRLNPDGGSYCNLVAAYAVLNRPEEARATADEALKKGLDSPYLHIWMYWNDFPQNDTADMSQQVAWSAGKVGLEDVFLAFEADSAASAGKLLKSRELNNRAVASAEHADENEVAAFDEAKAALREAYFGNSTEAKQRAAAALKLSTARDVEYVAGLALALAGDLAKAQTLADNLAKQFPEDTWAKFEYVPTLRGQIALTRKDPEKAIEALKAASQYEMAAVGAGWEPVNLYPVYVRGQAYLAEHKGAEAAAEFQKIFQYRGVVGTDPVSSLWHLGMARAYVISGDTAKARAAYQDFFALWKDADPDLPILKQARTEYAKLQ